MTEHDRNAVIPPSAISTDTLTEHDRNAVIPPPATMPLMMVRTGHNIHTATLP
jgi:hypothetical protein